MKPRPNAYTCPLVFPPDRVPAGVRWPGRTVDLRPIREEPETRPYPPAPECQADDETAARVSLTEHIDPPRCVTLPAVHVDDLDEGPDDYPQEVADLAARLYRQANPGQVFRSALTSTRAFWARRALDRLAEISEASSTVKLSVPPTVDS